MSENKIGIPLEGLAELGREAASQGAVLLQNHEKVLPLIKGENVAVFGRAQIDYYRSGTGSGGAVNVAYTTNLLEGLEKSGTVIPNSSLVAVYKEWLEANPFDNGGGAWAAEPWCQEEMPLEEETVRKAAAQSEKAIVVIGRTAGEDKDNSEQPGSYYLTSKEMQLLEIVTVYFTKVIVVLNVANIIDTSWIEKKEWKQQIKAVIYAWQGGIEGGNAIADVLTGKVTPSGKLTDTIAYDIQDYPSHKNHGGDKQNIYQEDIYVGYRYFETFAPQKVQFPFGHGLSYTSFTIDFLGSKEKENGIEFEVSVTNSGKEFSGKEVVQIYCQGPQGQLGRPAKVLIGFAKTNLLDCGQTQILTIFTDWESMAAYDETGGTGYQSSFVLEEGEYAFHCGNSIRNTRLFKVGNKERFLLNETKLVKQLQQAGAPKERFQRLRPGKALENGIYEMEYESVPLNKVNIAERINENLPVTREITFNQGIKLQDVGEGKATMEAFIAQFSQEELAAIVRGEGMCSNKVTEGTAAAFGGVTDSLLEYGIPVGCCADGPSGIRMDNGSLATQLPIGTLLACTWDIPLVEHLFTEQGKELLRNEIDTLLGPGINIHRHPLNGRNFEYFSEDPYITGAFAAAITRGIGTHGAQATIKHFACNSQETRRTFVNSIVSERALREIYLKGFEIGVKQGGAQSIMTSYNPINGHWAASNYDLNTTILRKEWGFAGIVMTDWWAKMNDVVEGGPESVKNTRDMIRAQNDLYMVVENDGAFHNSTGDNTIEALESGRLTIGELQRNAANICRFLLNSPAYARKVKRKNIIRIEADQNISMTEKAVKTDKSKIRVNMMDQAEGKFMVEQPGVYTLSCNIMSQESALAQSVTQVVLNGEEVATYQTNGTGGIFHSKKLAKVELEKGGYQITLHHLKPGICTQYMELEIERG